MRKASANISVNTAFGEIIICFYSSSQDCNLIQFTQYNINIADMTENIVYMNESITESDCVNVTDLLPNDQCAPFTLFVQPVSNYITYSSVHQLIKSGIYNSYYNIFLVVVDIILIK